MQDFYVASTPGSGDRVKRSSRAMSVSACERLTTMMNEKVNSAAKETLKPIHYSVALLSCLPRRRKLLTTTVVPEEFFEIRLLFNAKLLNDPFGCAKFVESVGKIVGMGAFSKRVTDERRISLIATIQKTLILTTKIVHFDNVDSTSKFRSPQNSSP